MKQMLRKMCAERPKDWDRYLPALLFAIREVPQESLGFSPFELLYGRVIKGPMNILRELWSGEVIDEEIKTTYQYVLDLRDKLESTCKLARENLVRAKTNQKYYYNQKAKDRQFAVGDKVLLLMPTSNNKLLVQWKGPYIVTEVVNKQDYRIKMGDVEKVFNVNMMKQYVERQNVGCVCTSSKNPLEEDDSEGSEDGDKIVFVTSRQSENYSNVHIDDNLNDQQKFQVGHLLKQYNDVLTDVPGRTDVIQHDIKLTSTEPIRTRNYPIPFKSQKVLDLEVDKLLEMGVIEPSDSPYASPIVMVNKPDGSVRVCIDYRKINKVTVFDAEPMPDMEAIFTEMAGHKFYSKLDLTKGYYQVPLTENAKPMTAFETYRGLMQFTVSPFGLVNSGATFCRMMRKVLRGLSNTTSFVDDIWLYTDDWSKHLEAIDHLFQRLRDANLTAKPSKCGFGAQEIQCLGHRISSEGLQPDKSKVDAIGSAERPTTKKQVRSFLGLASFYRKFIANHASIAVPLTDLTKKNARNKDIEWGDAQEKAFQTLKTRITKYPILRLPNFQRKFVVQTDASEYGIGAVLCQEYDDGKFPVAFASRKLNKAERNYSVIEKECLGIVWAIEKFHRYLYGTNFDLETDHQPLAYLQSAKTLNARIMRWSLRLQPYRFRIVSIRGRDNQTADYLSRA